MAAAFRTLSGRPGSAPLPQLVLFALIGISLVAAVILIISTIDAERDQRAQASKTSEILLELRNVGHAAINAETGERGYFITLDKRYLAPYRLGHEQYRPALDRLRQLIDGQATERQKELLTEIDQLTSAKFAEIDDSVGMIERGELADAQARFLSDEGQEVMDRLRRALGEMERIEQNVLAEATTRSAVAEARVLPMLLLLLVMLLGALALGWRQAVQAARAEAAEAHAADLAEARDRADLLAKELNHRVKNLFAVILAIVRLSVRSAPQAKPVIESIADRIQALLIAHEVTQGNTTSRKAADLSDLIETTLAPHRSEHTGCSIAGPTVPLPPAKVQPLGLVLHELATNAVKYGAWSQDGTLKIAWTLDEQGQHLSLEWEEHCPQGCAPSERKGFGSMLMDSSARQLQGSIERTFTPNGCQVSIAFPLD
ncbi:hypothetical protein MB02_06705 [Croceicoccus estronivorus]|nr:hypothetical protein MB02_06705 [Croceicoccus estronivorus]